MKPISGYPADQCFTQNLDQRPGRRSATGPPSFTFADVVKLYRSEGLTLSAATRKAIDYFPDLHRAMMHGERGPIIQTPVKPIQRTGATSMEFRIFEQAVAAVIRAGKSRSEAIRQVVKDHPELHEEYIERMNA